VSQPLAIESRVDDPQCAGIRLDVFISEKLGLFSRSQARLRVVSALVNGSPARLSKKLKLGDLVAVTYAEAPPSTLDPEDILLSILFENDDVVVLDKPQGMVVHPGSGNRSGTLVNALLFHYKDLARLFAPDDPRPGIVHRLDKDTSGVIITAKNARAHEELARQFRDRLARKRYVAVVAGKLLPKTGVIETRLARDPANRKRFTTVATGGRVALTRYTVLRSFPSGPGKGYSLVLLAPRTGRTHQLRVHMRHMGAPIVGDPLYGSADRCFPDATLMLHARRISLTLPGETQARTFEAALPERFRAVLRRLQSFSPR
jgi:23S rRNA pseudouridine1911/1915/1917 synthase